MMNEEVRRIMTTNPPIATPNQKISEISEFMINNKYQQLPVAEDGQLVGMLTTYDMWKALRQSPDAEHLEVKDVMTTKVIKITPIDKVGTAAELFMDKRFKTLPVVNLRNELKGVVTSFDVMKYVIKQEYPRPILYRETIES